MFKENCLNPSLAELFSKIGHTDSFCVSDAGLPVPENVPRIDLVWKKNKPGWLEVCEYVSSVMTVEKIYLAREICQKSPKEYSEFKKLFPNVEICLIEHEVFKQKTADTKAIIRTGEFTSYCNCIFVAGVNF